MSEILLLLVEDEALLHIVLEEALTEGGFQVVVANNGTQAIEELNKDAERFKGVLTDIRLGAGPSGWDVGHRARELVPNMPIVYMSGDSSFEWSANGVPNSLMIGKPFANVQILTAISQLINESNVSA
ncbi:transcriptional regulator [Rhizobium sp. Root73]|uniref:response regulator n=1 Tax=unclassified Rhizobium TaxID=2613769 RepID=UPI00072BC000|nr:MULTISPECIES: response regulator [unclassified Rhizobium]KQY12461.1 transcriptional regulator [Rhizobium sp. Root1334]KRC04475.1 transcriptional regulator [Rhizobium sp. Root73]